MVRNYDDFAKLKGFPELTNESHKLIWLVFDQVVAMIQDYDHVYWLSGVLFNLLKKFLLVQHFKLEKVCNWMVVILFGLKTVLYYFFLKNVAMHGVVNGLLDKDAFAVSWLSCNKEVLLLAVEKVLLNKIKEDLFYTNWLVVPQILEIWPLDLPFIICGNLGLFEFAF
jgi:hypothetical protein